MTDTGDLSEDVRALLYEHIESYEQLETLLLLRRERHEEWTAERLAARLHVGIELVERALADLRASGLVTATGAGSARFVYSPASSGLDTAAGRLDREYAERPLLVIRLMSANSLQRLRTAALHTFADAFVLKKDKNDG